MSLQHVWRQAGSTRRAHLVVRWESPLHYASMPACGIFKNAEWMPETDDTKRCGLCRRLAAEAARRGDPME